MKHLFNVSTSLTSQNQRRQNNFSLIFVFISFVDLLPESITYSLESSPVTGISSNVKIDILAPTASFIEVPTTTDKGSRLTNGHSSKCTKMTSLDELNVISREIDKQITKKTNKILELLKEFLCGMSDKNSFHTQMIDASDTSLSDLLLIAKKLIKRHKFESNPNHKEFMRIKFLNFPTTSSDLGEFCVCFFS